MWLARLRSTTLGQAMEPVLEQAFTRGPQNSKDEYVSTEHLLLGIAHLKSLTRRDDALVARQASLPAPGNFCKRSPLCAVPQRVTDQNPGTKVYRRSKSMPRT